MRNDSFFTGPNPFRAARAAVPVLAAAFAFAAPAAAEPVFSETETRSAPPGLLIHSSPAWAFDNAGTNPRFTDVEFSTTEYYEVHAIASHNGMLFVQAKTAAELNALASPPASPFTVTAKVTMTNDEGETASGTITYQTEYERDSAAAPPEPEEPAAPVFSDTEARLLPPGLMVHASADSAFDNEGTNARITEAEFSTTEYYDIHGIYEGAVFVRAMTAAELNALASPPPSPFTVKVTVTMTNDEDQTASGTITYRTEYERKSAPALSQQ